MESSLLTPTRSHLLHVYTLRTFICTPFPALPFSWHVDLPPRGDLISLCGAAWEFLEGRACILAVLSVSGPAQYQVEYGTISMSVSGAN